MTGRPITTDALAKGAATEAEIEAVARRLAEAEAPQFGEVPAWWAYRSRAERVIVEARALKLGGVVL
jgi:hypothetical protein